MRAGGLERTLGRVHHAQRVLDGDPLVAVAARVVLLGPAQGGRISAVRPGTRWERLSFVEICTVRSAFRIAFSVTSVSGAAAVKLPPSAMKTFASPSRSARMAFTVSSPCSRGGSKTNSFWIESRNCCGGRSQIPIVRSLCTLECPRTGNRPAPGLPMLSCSRATLGDLFDGRDRVAVLGDAHRPAKDGGRGVAEHAGGFLDLGTAQVGGPLDGGPVQVAQVLCPVLEADRVPLDEVQVGAAPLQQQGPDGLQQGEIAVDAHREMQVGELGAHAADPAGRLRVLEPDETRLLEGVDGQDLGAVLLRLLQDGEHPRVVVPGFWLMITISLASYTSRIVTLALPMPVTS